MNTPENSLPESARADSQQQMGMPRRKRSPLAAMMLMAAALGGLPPKPELKQKRKCLLKGCDVLTEHNGGYCCAEHHAEGKRHTDQAKAGGASDAPIANPDTPAALPSARG